MQFKANLDLKTPWLTETEPYPVPRQYLPTQEAESNANPNRSHSSCNSTDSNLTIHFSPEGIVTYRWSIREMAEVECEPSPCSQYQRLYNKLNDGRIVKTVHKLTANILITLQQTLRKQSPSDCRDHQIVKSLSHITLVLSVYNFRMLSFRNSSLCLHTPWAHPSRHATQRGFRLSLQCTKLTVWAAASPGLQLTLPRDYHELKQRCN